MIIDSDVLIWYMRGNPNAYKTIEKLNGFYISVISYMELVQGMRNKTELTELRKAFRDWNTKILYINEEISAKAMFYVERHYLSHALEIVDALIASTALVNGLTILTGNDKHYRIIKELRVKKFNP
jgi:predicted nucleic acid-binding protein